MFEKKVINSIWETWIHRWNSWPIYIIHYHFSRMISLNTHQHPKEELLTLFVILHFFISSFSFSLSLLKLSCTKKNHVYNLHRMSYTLSFCYVMYNIVSEICIGGRFLEDSFCCYTQQFISAVANEFLIPYNLISRALQTQNLIL